MQLAMKESRRRAEGFTIFAGRRNGDKLEPLVREIEAAGGKVFARSLDARKEDQITAFLQDAERQPPLEVCIFNVGANVNYRLVETTEGVFRKVWDGVLRRVSRRARSSAPDVAARTRLHFLHRRDSQSARRCRICRFRERQVRPARSRPERGARARTKQHSRRSSAD